MSRARDIANLQSSKITADAGIDIDNINIDGTEIDLSSGDLTIDVEGDITLDANGGNIFFKDNGTEFLEFEQDGGGCTIRVDAANTDLKFVGNDSDGGGTITALTLDMSDAGKATFNSGLSITSTDMPNVAAASIYHDSSNRLRFTGGTGGYLFCDDTNGSGQFKIDASGNVIIGGGVSHADISGGTPELTIGASGNGDTNGGAISFVHNGSDLNSYIGGQKQSLTVGTYTATPLKFITSNTERCRLDAVGYFGIGGNLDPNFLLHINKGSGSYSPTGVQTTFLGINTANDATNSQGLYVSHLSGNWVNGLTDTSGTANTSWGVLWNYQNSVRGGLAYDHYGIEKFRIWSAYGHITFSTYDTVSTHGLPNSSGMKERMAIQTGGNIEFHLDGTAWTSSTGGLAISKDNSFTQLSFSRASGDTGSHNVNLYYHDGSYIGGINTSTTATSFVTSSDYRLKENVSYDWDATSRLKQLKPARFNWKADEDTTVDGFLAHEVSSIVPEAIEGEKDAMRDEQYEIEEAVKDDEGKIIKEAVMGTRSVPSYQSIDQSKLVPLLVKTIQELEARIAKLEGS